jgi:flagellar motor switch protein FliM
MLRRPVTGTAGALERVRPADLDGDGQVRFGIELGTGGRGLGTAPATFVTGLAEILMGGPGHGVRRNPTPLEETVFASRMTAALAPLAEVLPMGGLRLTLAASGALAGELVAFGLEMEVGPVAGTVRLAFPAAFFAPADVQAAGPAPDPDPALVSALQAVPLGLAVRFGAVRLPGDELERLAVGDVVRLAHPVDRPLVAEVDGQPLFLARPGRRGRRLAVQIADVPEESS